MAFVIPEPVRPSLPVAGSDDHFPVRRIYCVGRNYAEHTREMGHDPDREPPFFFQKSPDNLLPGGGAFPYPPKSNNVHWEMELVVCLKEGGNDIAEAAALDHIFGYAVALDMTRRDLQGEAKKAGRPWDVGKAFEQSAPCSAVHPVSSIGHPTDARIWLDQNGEVRQDGNIKDMIWSIPEQIAYLSGLFTLAAGDLILTGTPAGVGAVSRGDVLKGGVDGVDTLEIQVV